MATVPSIIPLPASLSVGEGAFVLGPETAITASGEALAVARRLRDDLAPATGIDLAIVGASRKGAIGLTLDGRDGEGYSLEVSPDGVAIAAGSPAGLFYGTRTLLQLLPSAIFRRAPVRGVEWTVPCLRVEDAPRFGWRGWHLDVGRHFMPKEFVLKQIDLVALHKLNVFHLHLTEDQGWRIDIRKYPKLTEVGAWRRETMSGHYDDQRWDGRPHGGFYTQDDIREIVAYAAERFVTVVPEIEMPGHSQAAIAAYPELGNVEEPLEVGTTWGVIENVYNVEDSTIRFLQDVLDEVLELFPSEFVHIGGDECPKKQWKESQRAQAKIAALGLRDEDELQSWFVRQMDRYLEAKGRRLVGWDEILEGGLAPGATVMSWRGEEGGIAAAKAGHDVVMAPWSHTYFDHYQSEDKESEPVAIGGFLPLSKVYAYEPIPEELNEEESKRVLGSQCQHWTEYMPNGKQVEYMSWPRTCAFSEVVWTPRDRKEYSSFAGRLKTHLERLQALDVNYRKPEL